MEERKRILKMLEEGKITAEEAAKLLEAIKEPPYIGKSVNEILTHVTEVLKEVSSTVRDSVKNIIEDTFSKLKTAKEKGEKIITSIKKETKRKK
jgi:gas vesicle protein